MRMNSKLKEKTVESLKAVLPITGIMLLLSVIIVPIEIGVMVMFLAGAVMLVVGMGLFQLGADIAMTPLGDGIGVRLSKTRHIALIALIGFLMGAIITIAEPDLQVLAEQVPSVPNYLLILTVAVGVGIFLAIAVLRILFKINLSLLLIGVYVLLLGLSFFVPADFIAVAFDSGGVTTGPITVPFIMALGVGLAASRIDKRAAEDSFGLVALASGGPILAVLILGCFYGGGSADYTGAVIPTVVTTRDLAREFASQLPRYAKEVAVSILPIVAVFFVYQLLSHRWHRHQIGRALVGYAYTFLGLVLFLCGVNVGFAPVGSILGGALATMEHNWLLVPIGMVIGYFIVKAEPAIQILNKQVQTVTAGTISARAMNVCLSVGVAVSVGLAMLRVLTGISIRWILIPGYLLALALSFFVPKIFVGIAFDSGGVASGPMTTTFLLPLSIGACVALGGDIMTDAFGVVALVALTPLIAVQIMGLVYRFKQYKLKKTAPKHVRPPKDGDVIVELMEG